MTCQPPIIRQKESSKHWGIISFVYGLSPEKTLPLIYVVKEAVFSIFGFSIPHIIVTRATLKLVQHVHDTERRISRVVQTFNKDKEFQYYVSINRKKRVTWTSVDVRDINLII
jgi:hypothetical protein